MSDPALDIGAWTGGDAPRAAASPSSVGDAPPSSADSRAPGFGNSAAGHAASARVVVDELSVHGQTGQELFGPNSFQIAAGQITVLTGPSGSGKTTLMRALLGQLPPGAARTGSVSVADHDVFALDSVALQRFRRTHVAYVGQDPGSALNPLMRVHGLLHEVAGHASRDTVVETLELVGLSAEHLRRRSGELSGGQQRRVALARALIRQTGVLILDEPLAGLHGALRTDIARLLTEIAAERATAILLSCHDTATVHAIADNVIELGAGRSTAYFGAGGDKRPPTSGAIEQATPTIDHTTECDPPVSIPRPASAADCGAISGGPRSAHADTGADPSAEGLSVGDDASASSTITKVGTPRSPKLDSAVRVPSSLLRANGIGASIDDREVLAGIDLELAAAGVLAVVGVSGAGKTTLARVIAGLHRSATGSLELRGASIPVAGRRRTANGGNGIQLVTQNPRSALNPRRTVAQTLGRPLRRIGGVPRRELAQRVSELLASVELAPELAGRYPHELSGGQRQRVALARALAAAPAVLICDEITSALDNVTAASIMALLDRIRAERDMGLLVISHDMGLVAAHCPHLVVLDHGRIVESGDTSAILAAPAHAATHALLG
ncbi:ATP-binding cassette domain-containing protein [Nocardia sp. NBC_01499]|uniref:ABC transporter ATP-binding protein n=1 Tax=Nocardia sp. NBC_01499 TaxID=2903597 RepID=UPI00386C4C13